MARKLIRPITALLLVWSNEDYSEETLVVWGGEFGKNSNGRKTAKARAGFKGRDHQRRSFHDVDGRRESRKVQVMASPMSLGFLALMSEFQFTTFMLRFYIWWVFWPRKFTYNFARQTAFRLTDVERRVDSFNFEAWWMEVLYFLKKTRLLGRFQTRIIGFPKKFFFKRPIFWNSAFFGSYWSLFLPMTKACIFFQVFESAFFSGVS